MFRDLSLKLKLPIYLSGVLAMAIVVLAVAAYGEVRRAQIGAASERLRRVSAQLANLSSMSFDARLTELATLAGDPAVTAHFERPDPGSRDRVAERLAEQLEAQSVLAVELLDAQGRHVLAVGDTSGVPARGDAIEVRPWGIGPLVEASGRIVYATTVPVPSGPDTVGTASLWRTVQVDSAGRQVLADLIGGDAGLLYGSVGGAWTDLGEIVPPPPLSLGEGDDPAEGEVVTYRRSGVGEVYAMVARLDPAPFYLIVELPRSVVLAGARAFLVRLLVLAPLALLFVAGSAWILGRTITRSLRETAKAAEAIASGETGHRVVVRGGDEVGRLAVSFNTMAQRVEDSQGALRELNASLARSNAELENFAYIASHDLREPLRMVRSFTQLLAERYSGRLDDDADQYIHFAVDGATRMEALIKGLLEYSRLDGARAEPTATDCDEVLGRALAILTPYIDEREAAVTHDPLPEVIADGDQLVRVFQNLLGNAMKFQEGEAPRVHVSAARRGDEYVFSIEDNGIGIDPEYHDRIFDIFKRLHGQKEFAGAGMGLSISKKIVEGHGGRIWVESTPGEGATFYFSLPAAQAMVA